MQKRKICTLLFTFQTYSNWATQNVKIFSYNKTFIDLNLWKKSKYTCIQWECKDILKFAVFVLKSDETAKFVWFIMAECGIEMPAFSKVKNLTFGGLKPDSFVEKVSSGLFYTYKCIQREP